MNSFFEEQVQNCIDAFYKLYNTEQYVSKKIFDAFLDEYHDVFDMAQKYSGNNYQKMLMIIQHGYEMIDIKNKKYIDKYLKLEKEYFDNLFNDIDSSIILDEEQRKAILTDEDYSLIVAGAGSGKTTTMAAKVKYLIERKHVKPNEIILLSFTNRSVDDLDELLNKKFNLGVEVLTFHKLGMSFLRQVSDKPISIIGDSEMTSILSSFFTEVVFCNKALLTEYMEFFHEYLHLDEKCLEYPTFNEYYKYCMDKKYEECRNDLTFEIKNRLKTRQRNLKTINGEYVKSEGEWNIANYLYKHNIEYQYEGLYPFLVDGKRSYKPDFTLANFDMPIYVEYYGLATLKKDGKVDSEYLDYKEEIEKKRKTHSKNGTDLIELYGRYETNDYYLPLLSHELKKRNIITEKKSEKEIFYRLLETSKSSVYMNLVRLMKVFIPMFKEKGYQIKDFSVLINNCNDKIVQKQLQLLKWAYIYYERNLQEKSKIDFQDMIQGAYHKMEDVKDRKSYLNYKYVIIDEYQDISYQRYNFIRKISDLFKAKIIAVGDDWQSIYSFSGSDINLFTNFCEIMGYGEIVKIIHTYRNSQELIDIAGEFISRNNELFQKRLTSDKHLNNPIELVKYDYNKTCDNLPQVLEELIINLYEQNPKHKILLLVRFNSEIDNLLDSKKFFRPSRLDSKIICKKVPEANIDFLTVHSSKGLGYDQVILLNGIDATRGFPSQMKDVPVIAYLKGRKELSIELNEWIDYAEERRLFYVALTRTKNKVYIMTPSSREYRSEFIKEIENHENVKVI